MAKNPKIGTKFYSTNTDPILYMAIIRQQIEVESCSNSL